jgi:hypothetical protein
VALRQDGEYWYGDTPTDVWEYFVRRDRDSPEPVRHWRQAICPCGCDVFKVWRDEETDYLERFCSQCDEHVAMFAEENGPAAPDEDADPWPVECICGEEEFEVVGVTAPFMGDDNSAKWFYLGLRCVGCGCLGEYASWIPRYNDHAAFLAML